MYKHSSDNPPFKTMIVDLFRKNGNIPLTLGNIIKSLRANYDYGSTSFDDYPLREMINKGELRRVNGTYKYMITDFYNISLAPKEIIPPLHDNYKNSPIKFSNFPPKNKSKTIKESYKYMIYDIFKKNKNTPLTRAGIMRSLHENYEYTPTTYTDFPLEEMISSGELKKVKGTYKYIIGEFLNTPLTPLTPITTSKYLHDNSDNSPTKFSNFPLDENKSKKAKETYKNMIIDLFKENGNTPLTQAGILRSLPENHIHTTYSNYPLEEMISNGELKKVKGTYKYIYNF